MGTRRSFFFAVLMAIFGVGGPAFAQVDLSGTWDRRWHEDWQESGIGPEVVNYVGLPITDEARTRALTYSTSLLSQPERQCLYYPPQYLLISPFTIRIWPETDATGGGVLAWHISGTIDRAPLTIWMDGRPHPSPNAAHTLDGFTTGRWEGNTLTTYTTHVMTGYLRRNGVPSSDEATFTMHLTRHGDVLTILGVVRDPVYLTGPYVLSRNWQLDPAVNAPVGEPCVPEAELPTITGQEVPHYLPDQNPFVDEMTRLYNLPRNAVLGGADTMYPEFRKTLGTYVPPPACTRYCCGWVGLALPPAQRAELKCIDTESGQRPPEPARTR